MFGALFGWRKASKCKKLIKKVQCRLKLLRSKRTAIVKQLREDIAQLLRNGHDQIAFSRLDQLYMDENMKESYELLDNFCEFVLMKLSYIRKHRDCSNDINEAVSSLIFASARLGNMPELQVISKLFGERYGQKFATSAVELLPGNLVNLQMIEKLSMNSVSDYAKNRLLDEIIRECFFQPGLLAIEYKPSPKQPQLSQVDKHNDTKETEQKSSSDFEFHHSTKYMQKELLIQSPQAYHENEYSVALQSSSPNTMPEQPLKIKDGVDSSSEYPEQSLVYLDDVEEFKSPARQKDLYTDDEQDQRMFIFKPQSPSKRKSARKRHRVRSISKDYNKHSINNDIGYEVYYSGTPQQRKHHKKIHHEAANLVGASELDGLVQSFRFWIPEEKPEDLLRRSRPPYLRAASLPQQRDGEREESGLGRASSLPMASPMRDSLSSPRHVHPKLPDYDELEAKFVALKRVHQESKLVMKC